jgi:hypothetical protein
MSAKFSGEVFPWEDEGDEPAVKGGSAGFKAEGGTSVGRSDPWGSIPGLRRPGESGGTECRAVSNGATLVPNRDPLNFPFPEPS